MGAAVDVGLYFGLSAGFFLLRSLLPQLLALPSGVEIPDRDLGVVSSLLFDIFKIFEVFSKSQVDVHLLVLFGHFIAFQELLHVGGGLALFVVDDAVPKPPHPVDFPLSLDSPGCVRSDVVIVVCSDFVEVRPEALLDLPGSPFHPEPQFQILDHVLELVEIHAHDAVVRQNLLELRELGPVFLDVEDHFAPPLDVSAFSGSPLIVVPDFVVAHLLFEAVLRSAVKTVNSVEVGA